MRKLYDMIEFALNDFREPDDGKCYLIFNAPLEDVLKNLPKELQDKIVKLDFVDEGRHFGIDVSDEEIKKDPQIEGLCSKNSVLCSRVGYPY